MSTQERRALLDMILSIVLTAIYASVIIIKYNNGDFDTSNPMRYWSMIILIFIPLSVVARIILMIVFRIFAEIHDEIKGEKNFERDLVDERDKLVELKGNQISLYVFMFTFIFALLTQIFSWGTSAFFITLVTGGVLSDILGSSAKILYYRKGV